MRLLLVITGLAWGILPPQGFSAVAKSAAEFGAIMTVDAGAFHHHGKDPRSAEAPCPHGSTPSDTSHAGHGAMAGGHCSACVTLPPPDMAVDAGPATRTVEAPGLASQLVSTLTAPPERPPRDLG